MISQEEQQSDPREWANRPGEDEEMGERQPESQRPWLNSSAGSWRNAPGSPAADAGALRRTLEEVIPRLAARTAVQVSQRQGEQQCEVCHGSGWLLHRAPLGDPERGRLVRCGCRAGEDAARQARVSGLLDRGKTFATFIPRPGTETALAAARMVAEGEKQWFFISSSEKGTGKSHLLAACANRLLERGLSVYITNWRRLLRRIYLLRDDPTALDSFIYQLETVDALLIDELRYKVTDWAWELLHEAFDARYQKRLTTGFTSNYTPAELEGNALRLAATDPYQTDQLDTLTSRLRDRRIGVIAENTASDYREVAAGGNEEEESDW
jgi:DNA replication protein DnaC